MTGAWEPETFRDVVRAHDPDGHQHTVIVTRRGTGVDERTWLSLGANHRTTVVLDARALQHLRQVLERVERRTGTGA